MTALTEAFKPISQKEVSPDFKQEISPAFEIVGDKKSKARITEMINQLSKSETGRQTLEIASKAGYTIGMEFAFGCNGGCSKENKHIVLNPVSQDDVLIGVLAHEARHAGQFERGEYDASDDKRPRNETILTNVMRTRAVEADAQATAVQALGELLENGNEAPLFAFCRQQDNASIAKAFQYALYDMKALQDGTARTAAFLAWYDNEPVKKAYDEGYQVEMMARRQKRGDHKTDTYALSQSASEIVKDLCLNNDGSCYFSEDAKVLESGHYAAVNKDSSEKIIDMIKNAPLAKKSSENQAGFVRDNKSQSLTMAVLKAKQNAAKR